MAVSNEDIRLAQNGDADAFSRVYNATIKTAYFVAKRILVDESEEAVEDVLQDSYVAIYTNINTFSTGNFQGWVDVIVANRAKNYLKKKKPMLFSQMESEDEDAPELQFEDENIEFRPDEQMDYSETKRLVMEIIDGLSEEQRTAVVLYYFDEMSVKDIAAACECSENTIKSRLNYARKNIKEKVEELEKKGTKLYCFPLVPFLYWLLKEEFKATTVSAAVLNNAGAAVMIKSGAVSVQSTAGLSIGAKFLIGVAGAAVISGAAIGGFALFNNQDKDDIAIEMNIDEESTDLSDKYMSSDPDKASTSSIDETSKTSYEVKTISKSNGTQYSYEYVQIEGWDNSRFEQWNKLLTPNFDTQNISSSRYKATILVQNENLLSVKISGSEMYTGGMHPMSYVQIYNINMQTGEEYNLKELVDIDAYCEKVASEDYTTDFKGGVHDNVLDEIYQCNSYAITGKTTTAEKLKAIIEENIMSETNIWSVHDGQVDMYFLVTHAAGDMSCISVNGAIK